MHVTYDRRNNVAYIQFRERAAGVETVRVSDELNIDLAPDGSLYGIELLNANEQIGAGDGQTLSVEHPVTGERIEVPWPGDAA